MANGPKTTTSSLRNSVGVIFLFFAMIAQTAMPNSHTNVGKKASIKLPPHALEDHFSEKCQALSGSCLRCNS
jgi:hypothetical protein